jgi:hypothetical protein
MSQKTSPKTRTIGRSVSEISEASELRPALLMNFGPSVTQKKKKEGFQCGHVS